MYKLIFSLLLLLIAAQPAVFGKPNKRASSERPRREVASTAKKSAARDATPVRARRSRAKRERATVTFPSGDSLQVVAGAVARRHEHRDPNGSGNPLLYAGGKNLSKKLTKNFSVGEFVRSGRRTFTYARIDPSFSRCLQGIRDTVGRPVRIDSGYRSFKYNKELYEQMGKRPTNSQHISGRAADIKIQGMTGQEIAEAAIDACGSDVAVGLGAGYAHVDGRGRFGIWKYKGVSDRQVAQVKQYRASRLLAREGRGRRARRVNSRSLPKQGSGASL